MTLMQIVSKLEPMDLLDLDKITGRSRIELTRNELIIRGLEEESVRRIRALIMSDRMDESTPAELVGR